MEPTIVAEIPPNQPLQNLSPRKPASSAILIVVIILLFLAIAFLAYQNYQLKQSLNQVQTILLSQPTPAPVTDPTADWTTYTNTKYKFSFKYPKELELVKGPASNLPYEEFSTWKNVSFDGIPKNLKDGLGISIIVDPADKDGKPFTCTTNEECLNELINSINAPKETVIYVTKSVGNQKVKGFKYATENQLYKSEYQYFIFLYSNNVLEINLYTNTNQPNDLDSKGINNVFDQILSTFRFTN